MKKYWKALSVRLVLLIVWILICVGSFHSIEIHSEQTKKSNRKVVMLDAWSYFSGKNSREKYEGFFRDKATGTTFTYPVSGHLHNIYVKDKKSIDMEFPLSVKDLGLVKDPIDLAFISGVGLVISLVWALSFLICAAIDWQYGRGVIYVIYHEWRGRK